MDAEGLHDALLRRARVAMQRAARVTARSRVLVGFSEQLQRRGLTSRCAWCGRYEVDGAWVEVGRLPPFAQTASASHTICPDCVAQLRVNGQSV